MERIAAAEQQADRQLMEAAMRKDAQEEAADKQAKAERKAEQLRYRSAHTLSHQVAGRCSCNACSSGFLQMPMQMQNLPARQVLCRSTCNKLIPLCAVLLLSIIWFPAQNHLHLLSAGALKDSQTAAMLS